MRRGMVSVTIAAMVLFALHWASILGASDAPSPALFQPGDLAPAAKPAPDRGVLLPLPFQSGADRFYWDVPLLPPSDNTAFVLEFRCDNPSAIRAMTMHLRDGEHWLTASTKVIEKKGTLVFHRGDFQPENGSSRWHKANTMRLSFWKGLGRPTVFNLRSLRVDSPSIAIVRSSASINDGQAALAASCAARAIRLFQHAGLAAAVVDDDFKALNFSKLRWVVLPYNPSLSDEAIDWLETFVQRHKGKVAVFYNANPQLAALVKVNLLPYVSQTQPWTTVEFNQDSIEGLPALMPHFTSHLLPISNRREASVVTAYWQTRDGFRDASLPAAVKSPHGVWFSHIPPLATPSAIQWLVAQLAASDADLRPRQESLVVRMRHRQSLVREFQIRPSAVTNEIRAVWSLAIPARRREAVMQALSQQGINVLLEHVATAGALRQGADSGLASLSGEKRPAQRYLNSMVDVAQRTGLAVHAWVNVFNAEALPDAMLARFRREGRLMLDADGNPLPWLSPSHPDNRAMLKNMLQMLAVSGLAGIHLDYVRYPARQGCYSLSTRRAFQKRLAAQVENWPLDVLPDGRHAKVYEDFRRREITTFLREAVSDLRQSYPELKISAAVYPTADSAAVNGQDWPVWLQEGLFDFICPMIYTPSQNVFEETIATAATDAALRRKLVPGIGVTADESQLDALATVKMIDAVRKGRFGGFALFQLDAEVLNRTLPVLSLSEALDGTSQQ